LNSGGASPHTPPSLADPRTAAGDAAKQGSVTASSPLPVLVGGEKQCHLQSQENTTNSRLGKLCRVYADEGDRGL